MKISILGAGGWGSVLASVVSSNHHSICLWAREPEIVDELRNNRTNTTYLADFSLPSGIHATNDLEEAIDADAIVIATPTQFIRSLVTPIADRLADKLVISVSKGIENATLMRVSEILNESADIDPDNFAALTGPSHAEEVAKGMPTTVVAASQNKELAQTVQKAFTTPKFRVYSADDVIGAELGGALKNVMAVSAGILDGLEFGDNTKAALMTRGLAEIARLGSAMGANPITFSGLSGLGDLIVTCTSVHSRNRWVGEQIGRGKTLKEVLASTRKVAEGVATTQSVRELMLRNNVEMPIVDQVHSVLFEDKDPRAATNDLMMREAKPELWW